MGRHKLMAPKKKWSQLAIKVLLTTTYQQTLSDVNL